MLITEVKSALADDGVGDDSAIVVDGDHGKVLLSGEMMKSADDASHAGDIAAHAPGVVAVKNQLTWCISFSKGGLREIALLNRGGLLWPP